MKRFNLMLLYLLTSFIDRFTEPGGIRGELFSPPPLTFRGLT